MKLQQQTPTSLGISTSNSVGTPQAMLDRQKHRLLLSNFMDKPNVDGITPKNA